MPFQKRKNGNILWVPHPETFLGLLNSIFKNLKYFLGLRNESSPNESEPKWVRSLNEKWAQMCSRQKHWVKWFKCELKKVWSNRGRLPAISRFQGIRYANLLCKKKLHWTSFYFSDVHCCLTLIDCYFMNCKIFTHHTYVFWLGTN